MNKKSFPYIALLVLLLITVAVRMYKKSTASRPTHQQQDAKRKKPEQPPGDNPNRAEGFNRRTGNLIYTQHARCRMACRNIDETEVKEILEQGTINYAKSALDNPRGPRYALEGTTHDNQQVRIVFAQDAAGTAVITVIDLGEEWKCSCD